jgi:superfamily II DNA or RNA helicase
MQGVMDWMDSEWQTRLSPKTAYVPRPYQSEADRRVWEVLQSTDRTALYMATGCGKTEVAALLLQRDWGRTRNLFVTPRRELVRQSADRLRLRGVACGVEMAEQRADDDDVVVACYASLQSRKRYQRFLGTVGLVIVDESHLNYSPAALQMLAEFRSFGAKVCGMTASPPTGKDQPLAEHYGQPAYVYDYQQAVAEGYLVGCKMHLCVLEDLDLSRFKSSFGDFDAARLDRLMRQKANVAGVGAMVEEYWEGKPSVVFASSIAHAEAVRDDLWGRGIQASIVHSRMEPQEQRLHLNDFMNGRSEIVINVGILTLGWDAPHVRKLFVARPTASTCLYTQMFGRGTRTLPGVIDGLLGADERLAAIAASDKRWFEVYDITDSSRHNDLKTALDVLRPSLDDRLMKRVRARIQRSPIVALDIDPIIEEERRALAAQQAELDRMEMERRKHIRVDGRIVAYERDALADAEEKRGSWNRDRTQDYWWMPFGRFKGRGFKAIHAECPWYLPWMLKKERIKSENLARNIRRFLAAQK